MDVSKSPATIQRNNVVVNEPPELTRAKTTQDARKEPTSAGTATQCARWPSTRPKTILTSAPASGSAGISQSVDTASLYHANEVQDRVDAGKQPRPTARI